MNIPIIRLEIEGMRNTICMALTEQQARMDEYVQEAVKRATSPENIQAVVEEETWRTLEKVLKEEVQNFFMYNGEGRKIIAKAVKEKLLSKETFTPLDDEE